MKNKLILFSILVIGVTLISGCVQPPSSVSDDNQTVLDDNVNDSMSELEEVNDTTSSESEDEGNESMVNETSDMSEEETDMVSEEKNVSSLQRVVVEETELVDLDVEAEDLDNEDLTYEFSNPLDGDGEWQTDFGDAGEYVISINVSDGENVVSKRVLLVVEKNNVAPEITGLEEEIEIDENESVEIVPSVSDANGDELNITYDGPVDSNGFWKTGFADSGEYTVEVTASDGELETTETVDLIVNDVNRAPVIGGVEDEISVEEGETLTLEPRVSDPDGDEVEVSISEPVGNDGVWEIGYNDHGNYTVTIEGSDGEDTNVKEVSLEVLDVNVPPEIVSISQG